MDKASQILKFESSTCVPCETLSKSIEALGNIPVPILKVAIDTDDGQITASKFRVRSVPTLLALTDEGLVAGIHVGSLTPSGLREWLATVGVAA